MTVCYQELRSILFLVANGHHNCIKYTKADVRLRTPDEGQKGCPKHVVVIPIKLEFSASFGLIHDCVGYSSTMTIIWYDFALCSKHRLT
jgi:hypothetical protein